MEKDGGKMVNGNNNKTPRVIVLGFDAATWNIIDPLLGKGELPNFKAMINNGVRGNLHSLESPVSPRVWTSIVTGKTEIKHGIMDFYSNRSHLKSKRIWDILNEKGQSCSIFYWFVTWPPQKEIKGHMVPGFLSMDTQTVPSELSFLKELEMNEKNKIIEEQKGGGFLYELKMAKSALRFGVKPLTLFKAILFKITQKFKKYVELDVFAKVQLLKLYLYGDVFKYMLRNHPTDFAAILFPQADQIGHKYWAYYEPDRYEEKVGIHVSQSDRLKYGDVIPHIYREMDKLVGDILKTINDDDILMIISDHGFGMIEEPRAQLKIKNTEFFEHLGLRDVVHGFSIGPDYIIQVADSKHQGNMEKLAKKFKNIQLEDSEESLFDVTIKGKEIILGLNNVWVMDLKDAMILLKKNLKINGKSIPVSEILAYRSDISGDHEQIGIFLMAGKNIKQGQTVADCSVLDITPTFLYLKDLPIAKDMDGKPIVDAFEPGYIKQKPVSYIDTYENPQEKEEEDDLDFAVSDELQDRLKGLGYLN